MGRTTEFSSLHVAWKLPLSDGISVNTLQERMAAGQGSGLFELKSWDCREGKVSAVLTPAGPIDEIVAIIWGTHNQPVALRLVEERSAVSACPRPRRRRA
jgi:hypothetical protein